MISILNERLIRGLVHDEAKTVDVETIDEARIFSSVVDVLAPTLLHAFEVKSAADDLRRLARQATVAERTLPRVTLVTTESHADEARKIIGPWWGLWVAREAPNGHCLDHIREATEHEQLSGTWVLGALRGSELQEIARANGIPSSGTRHALVQRLLLRIGESECIRLAHTLLSIPSRWSKFERAPVGPILASSSTSLFPLPV